MFGSAGYYTLKDNVDGEGVQFNHDLRLYAGQLGAKFAPTDSLKVTLGGSGPRVTTTTRTAPALPPEPRPLLAHWRSTATAPTNSVCTKASVRSISPTCRCHCRCTANTYNNAATDSDEDNAWLVGFKSKLDAFSLDYNYRDIQA